ncbi:nestin [Hippopotamus amphibius kiboko]|uniref:nestin n=1 Tax=Hippopotamus amphibius kiboko TaxID=575201 RepID=UPI002598C61A|nr:nestin [Hippopotamus amphibius kiboko]
MEGCLGEESFQMWELNRRLEAYLARVKALEEQNELLSAELGGLRAQAGEASWRARADDELAALRAFVDQRWREKHAAEVARDNLAEEVEGVAGRCQQLRLARERTAEEVTRSRRAVEAEKCAQAWLSTQVAELERELEALRVAHEEERASLNAQAACAPCGPAPPRGPPVPAPEVEELAQRLGEAWRGAVRGYQERVAHMETSLGQARERLGLAVQGAREGRLELQQLQAERSGLQERRAALEQRLEGRWQERLRATEQFQLAMEALEQEKQGLQSQIAQVLEGRQQLAHLKMSLSLEVATYRTLLEAENSRLQAPGSGSKAPLSFLDPKLELHFPGTPEGRRPAPLLSVLSPTPLSSPLPDTLETPVPAFLKSQEFLQTRTPTSASTPIPPTSQAPCPATDAEIRAQDAPLSLPQPRVEKQQVPEAVWAEAKVAIPASVLPGPEEPGGKQQEASPGQSPEDLASLAPAPSPDHPSLEAKDGEPSGSRESSRCQEEGEGQIWGLAEKETAVEVKVVSSLQQETWQEEGDLDVKEIQDSQGPLEKETLKSLEEEIQEPLISLEKQSHETMRSLEKENQESLRSLEEENLEILKTLEKENQELLKSLDGKEMEVVRPLEKETLELLKPIGKEDPQTLQSLEKENQEIMRSLQGNVETFLSPGKENQELVRSLEEENFESLRALEKESQEPLRCQEVENQKTLHPLAKENQEPLRSLEEEDQETAGPLDKENHESLRALEDENQETLKHLEKESQESLRSLEKESQESLRSLEKESQESLRSLEKESQESLRSLEEGQEAMRPLEEEEQEILRPLDNETQLLKSPEKEKQDSLRALEEDQEARRPLEEEDQEPVRSLEKEKQESLRALEEDQEAMGPLEEEDQEPVRSLEKEKQESLRALEEDQEAMGPLEEEDQEPVRSLEKEKQESLRALEENQETLRPLKSLEKEEQMTLSPLEKVKPEPQKSPGKDQEIVRPLEKENQELLRSLNEEGVEAMRSLETETLEPLKPTGEENLEILKSLEKESQEPLGSVEGNEETLKPLEKENQESLSSLGEQKVENMRSPEEVDKGSQRYLEEEENVEKGETQEALRSLEEEGQELPLSARLQKWEDSVQRGQELDQDMPPGRAAVDSEVEAELEPREQDSFAGKGGAVEQGELQLTATSKAWSPGEGQPASPEPKEQRVSAEGAKGVGGTESLQEPEKWPEQVGALGPPDPQEVSEVIEPVLEDEDVVPRDGRASQEVTLGLETALGESVGAEQRLEQEVVGLEDPGGLAREEVMEPPLGEEGLETKRVQGLEGPRKELEEAGALEPELSTLPGESRDPLETPRGWEESEPGAPVEAEETFPPETLRHNGSGTPPPRPLRSEGAEEDAKPALGPPSPQPTESCSPTPIPEDAPGPQPLAEGSQEASWGLEGRAEVLGKVGGGQEDLGSGAIPEGLQEEGEESREESEADELGETLPDSTPLGLYLRSPASPKWDLAGEQRPSPQGETGKEGWGPAVLASEGLGARPSEEERGEEEEERGRDSELSEEFEDLGTEASLLPGVPGEVADPLGQVPPLLLEPAAWDRDGESDGFADEEESGEEGEEEDEEAGREPGAGRWGPGPSVGSLPAPGDPQRRNLLGSEPWDDGFRGATSEAPMPALEAESRDSTEASGSEGGSDAASLEREDQVPGPLGTLRGGEDTGLEAGDALGVNGQGPSLKEELEHVNGGVVNGLEQSEGVGQGEPGAPEGDRGSPLEEEGGGALKIPWAGAPLHLGQGQFLKFSQKEGDGDSWSSGED